MKLIFAFLLILLIFPISVHAEWYWLTIPDNPKIGDFTELSAIDYAVTSISKDQLTVLPEDFMGELSSSTKSKQCSGEYDSVVQTLRDFDSNNEFYTKLYYKGTSANYELIINQDTVNARNDLLKSLDQDVSYCLKQEQIILKEQSQKEAEQERQAEINKAIENCDIDFFQNQMTDKERMDTWSERQACSQDRNPVNLAISTEVKAIQNSAPVTSSPVTVTKTISKPKANTPEKEATSEIKTTVSSSTPTTSDQTNDQVVPEQTTTPPQQHISLLQRISNFFRNLFHF